MQFKHCLLKLVCIPLKMLMYTNIFTGMHVSLPHTYIAALADHSCNQCQVRHGEGGCTCMHDSFKGSVAIATHKHTKGLLYQALLS